MGCVYEALNTINGKRYIGKTEYTLANRRYSHEWAASHDSTLYFHKALRKHTFDAFVWRVLIDDMEGEDLNVAERLVIRRYKTNGPGGYNLTDGGEGVSGCVWDRGPTKMATKAKISDSLMGHTVTLASRIKMSKSHTGVKDSEERKANKKAAHKRRVERLGASFNLLNFTREIILKRNEAIKRSWAKRKSQKVG